MPEFTLVGPPEGFQRGNLDPSSAPLVIEQQALEHLEARRHLDHGVGERGNADGHFKRWLQNSILKSQCFSEVPI